MTKTKKKKNEKKKGLLHFSEFIKSFSEREAAYAFFPPICVFSSSAAAETAKRNDLEL